jgi:L-ascorbate metabolism protein UlaG (beta-lactamase superfamily)
LTTQTHPDHINAIFVDSFPGQQLYVTSGKIELPDVTITSIPSANYEGDAIKAKGGGNYIFLIETGGLRIAHFGDTGQDALTTEQLATLGEIDLAITQLANSYSHMNASNQKGSNLMKQVKPHLIIPTHFDNATLEQLLQEWPNGYFVSQGPAILSKDKIPDGTGLFYMGAGASAYGKIYSLQEWK